MAALAPFPIMQQYLEACSKGQWHFEPHQAAVIEKLDQLSSQLTKHQLRPPVLKNFWHRLFHDKRKALPPRKYGIYIYGDVGRGKSMLMDLFFKSIPIFRKKRSHFHQFMAEVHQQLWLLREQQSPQKPTTEGLLTLLAQQIATEISLLCFDEFHVANIADAMILGRLFKELFQQGVVVVATSNWAPRDLYKNGLQRNNFLPFIDIILRHMDVYELTGPIDYRQLKLPVDWRYLTPLTPENQQKMENIFYQLTKNNQVKPTLLKFQSRQLMLQRTAGQVLWADFQELCLANLGASDYLEIAQNFRYVLLLNVPQFSDIRQPSLHRFVTLVDVLYDNQCYLICTAEVEIPDLYPNKDGQYMGFGRTISRLQEMRSADYPANDGSFSKYASDLDQRS